MTPPMFKLCACGHLGSRHRDDGSCVRCECPRFTLPVRVYARSAAVAIKGQPARRRQLGARPVR